MTTQFLASDLERDEGRRLLAYQDSRGIWTIGVGHNIEADPSMLPWLQSLIRTGITEERCLSLLAGDIAKTSTQLDQHLAWWRKLDDVRQDAIVNLAFNLGEAKLATWAHTLGDIETGKFKAASVDLVNDEPWASQVHDRARRIAFQIETGVRAWDATEAHIEAVLNGQLVETAPEPSPAAPEPSPVAEAPAPLPTTPPAPEAAPAPSHGPSGDDLPAPSLIRLVSRHLASMGVGAAAMGSGVLAFAQAHPIDAALLGLTAILLLVAGLWLASRFAHQHQADVKHALMTPPPGLPPLSADDIAKIIAALRQSAAPGGS